MLKLIGKKRVTQVEFCERCGEVCDSVCRAEAARRQILYTWRLV